MEENHQILTSKKLFLLKKTQMTIKNFVCRLVDFSSWLFDYLLQLHKLLLIRKPRQNNVYLWQNILLFASA